MNMSELTEQEILDFLMTSDFEGDFSPSEFKYLLVKWRNFYRLQKGKLEQQKSMSDGEILFMKNQVEELENKLRSQSVFIDKLEMDFNKTKNRKLTWKERWSGKIIINDEK